MHEKVTFNSESQLMSDDAAAIAESIVRYLDVFEAREMGDLGNIARLWQKRLTSVMILCEMTDVDALLELMVRQSRIGGTLEFQRSLQSAAEEGA